VPLRQNGPTAAWTYPELPVHDGDDGDYGESDENDGGEGEERDDDVLRRPHEDRQRCAQTDDDANESGVRQLLK